MDACKVLILGGYGTFGGRLAQLLADEPRLTLVIAGRSHAKAEAFCAALSSQASAVPMVFDRTGDVVQQLQAIAPDMVVDATGPFQQYTGDAYKLVRAAIALGIHYLDLADGAAFVKGIAQFDTAARERGVLVLSGVSSFPVLTAAVVRRLAIGLTQVDTITAGIAPSPYANVGQNVIRAIASYAGKPVSVLRDGRRTTGYALIDTVHVTIAPPGRLPLDRVRFSLVEVPDLEVLPDLWPGVRSVWMGAGPVPEIWHRALSAFAWLVRLKIVPSLLPLAPLMDRVVNRFRWGEHRGGMFVTVQGRAADGGRIERSWFMIAEADDGPLIPSMAAEAIIRKSLAGRPPANGARAATTDLELADYEAMFARKRITTGTRETAGPAGHPDDGVLPLYRRLLGEAYARMPEPLQVMHDLRDELVAEGAASVERGSGLVARLVARLIGFPPEAETVPVKVVFRRRGRSEHWHRSFGERAFSSIQMQGEGGSEWLLCEAFGPIIVAMAPVLEDDRLRLLVRQWRLLGLPMPRRLAPCINAYEYTANGRFHFHVEIGHPWAGSIVAYRGWLVPNRPNPRA